MFRRILVVVGESDAGRAAFTFAADLASEFQATVHICPVVLQAPAWRGGRRRYAATRALDQRVGAALRGVGLSAAGPKCIEGSQQLIDEIADEALRFRADLIVLGLDRERISQQHHWRNLRQRLARATSLPLMVAPTETSPARRARPHAAAV